ncbi:MAG: GH39 family glycosyl hydrolase, partial [Nocardioidaceae bacterium]
SLSYWVVSDHFEELGRPPALLHGGFGLRTVGELRKPRWWALALLERLGPRRLPVQMGGDGGGSLVETVATRSADGEAVSVLAWNMTLDQTKAAGCDVLAREVEVRVDGLRAGATFTLTHHRVDAGHSNVAAVWGRLRGEAQAWPDDAKWARLRESDRLEQLQPVETVAADGNGTVVLRFVLPMPAMSLLELSPA